MWSVSLIIPLLLILIAPCFGSGRSAAVCCLHMQTSKRKPDQKSLYSFFTKRPCPPEPASETEKSIGTDADVSVQAEAVAVAVGDPDPVPVPTPPESELTQDVDVVSSSSSSLPVPVSPKDIGHYVGRGT